MANAQWRRVALANVADLRLSSVDKKIMPGERQVRLCNYSDVYHRRVLRADANYMEATANEREIRNCRLALGDVIITKDSETPDDIGVPAVVGEEIPNLVCGYHLAIIRPTKSMLDGVYLFYALGDSHAKRQFQQYANGITRFGLRAGDIARVSIPLPAFSEQRKIAAILSSVDDAIEKTRAVIDQVQVVKRGLMQELLTRGLPGRHTRFKQTVIGKIPCSWELFPLEHFVTSGPDNGLYRPQRDYGDGTPIIRIDAFDNGDGLRSPQLRRVVLEPQDVARFAVKPGDILINRVNSLTHLAKCALVMSFDEPTVYESNMMRLCLNGSRLTTEFGFMWLSSEHVKADLRAKAKRAVAQASVNQNDVLTIPTPCPPHAEQQHITRVIGEVDQRLELEGDTLERLRDAKSALSSALLTGVLRVAPDPADA